MTGAAQTLRSQNRFARPLPAALAALLLLLAQTIAVGHSDLDEHPAGDVCALCVSLAHFGAANVSSAIPFEIDSSAPLPELPKRVAAASRYVGAQRARGPPLTF